MKVYRLSQAAAEDIAGIARFGDERFGFAQSDRYRDDLTAHFESLAFSLFTFPLSATFAPGIAGAYSARARSTIE